MIAFTLCLALQNLVEEGGTARTLPPVTLSEKDLHPLLKSPASVPSFDRKLDRHVAEFVDGFPWRPFHHTLGISGYESYFGHPDRVFLALSEALPHLSPATAPRVRAFLAAQLKILPPWAPEGYDPGEGNPREAYEVPEAFRLKARARGTGLLGVHAFHRYVMLAPDPDAARAAWPALKARVHPLLDAQYRFDPLKKDYTNDEAQTLNTDLAGLLAFVQLARQNGDAGAETAGSAKALELLQLRITLERGNPRFMEKTNSSSSHLHVHKLARYCDLTPALAEAVRVHSEGLAVERLKLFREERNAWWLAFGDRMIGGENYTNPPHFVDALFRGAALLERLRSGRIASFIDIPWCKGDLYFIERVALAQATPD